MLHFVFDYLNGIFLDSTGLPAGRVVAGTRTVSALAKPQRIRWYLKKINNSLGQTKSKRSTFLF
jgi:hypothetical protein